MNGIDLTLEQEEKINKIFEQWKEEAALIEDHENDGTKLCNGQTGSFYNLTCKYQAIIKDVLNLPSEAIANG